MSTEEYVPTTIPMSSARAKSVSESPPSSASAARMNITPMPVFTVRGTVWRIAWLVTRASGAFASLRHSSRMRSKTTTESFTE